MKRTLIVVAFLHVTFSAFSQTPASEFDKTIMEFKGTKTQQLRILMRKVGLWGKIIENEAIIDSSFTIIIDSGLDLTKNQLKLYLQNQGIVEREVGGSIDSPISHIILNGEKVFAKYFVIHDVSTPAFKDSFPKNINDSTWVFNMPQAWTNKITHTYVTRTGKLNTVTDFSVGWRATKLELKVIGVSSRGLFIHIELIQPRVYPPGTKVSAPIAPIPGFTDIQYEKLALLYVCASIRKGAWLIPSFHANIDEGLNDGHDDPQNFETDKFTNKVLELISKLKQIEQ